MARLVRLAKLVALAFAVAATVALAPVRPSEPAPSQPQITALTAPAVAIKSSDAAPAVHRILPTGSEPKPAAAQRAGSKAVWAALTRLGSPYVWAAAGPDAFDCSGHSRLDLRRAGSGRSDGQRPDLQRPPLHVTVEDFDFVNEVVMQRILQT